MNVSVDKSHEVSAAFTKVALICFYDFSIIRIVPAINGSFWQAKKEDLESLRNWILSVMIAMFGIMVGVIVALLHK
jgi:hypothetical protein